MALGEAKLLGFEVNAIERDVVDAPNAPITRKLTVIQPTGIKTKLPRKIGSLCPECIRTIMGVIYEDQGRVMLKKTCPDHGEFSDVYYSDVELFLKFEGYALDGVGIDNPHTQLTTGCPYDCGLCNAHTSHPGIVNVDLTNRCNLKCPICFANANSAGFVFEPPFEDVVAMMRNLRDLKPVPVQAIQFAGGEPTIYPRFFDAVKAASDLGFPQIQVATNAIRLAKEPDFAQKFVDNGGHMIYLQFDGFRDESYIRARKRPGFLKEKFQAIENCRRVRPKPLAVTLVPVIVKNLNNDEVGDIIRFALNNLDVVRSVNFQPVSFSGRMETEDRMRGRYTQSDLVFDAVQQTGFLTKNDFFPVPVAAAISEVVSVIHGEAKLAFTCHPACGIGAYVVKGEDGRYMGVSQFIDIDGLYNEALKIAEETQGLKASKVRALIKARRLLKYVDLDKAPKGVDRVADLLRGVFYDGSKAGLSEFHWNTLFVGAMHFMDRYNYDIDRVKRCIVHYATPDGRIIPFCAYNTGPTFRTEIESKFAMTFKEYAAINGGSEEDIHT
jgi:uncharacterized radical SAM superfamily Fe-S cluster-containing enzyme